MVKDNLNFNVSSERYVLFMLAIHSCLLWPFASPFTAILPENVVDLSALLVALIFVQF
ncbi:Protein of unknown function [Pyronema omphalodes CBS 100304]|uniref:Uncharacterized protein n=1 Tax=Pyronema omphalodes (strain CBS 100304) TaxID=1076935 RepID=U4LMX7_PYROM|nr:Protein of unknown function [Pyronema omphalodes CBS 100304]